MNLAIIPARGGSKRIPGKNIKNFAGKPIISYSIDAAQKSGMFDEVMVSTDNDKIATVARACGASVPFVRSDNNSDDYATIADVVAEVIREYQKHKKEYEWICVIYPTAPFVTADKLRAAFNSVLNENADGVLPVTQYSYPPQRGLVIEESHLKMKWPENLTLRSQDLEPIFHDSGQFCFVKTEAFLREKTLFLKKTIPFIVSELEVQDVDSETDWTLAELKYQLMLNGDC